MISKANIIKLIDDVQLDLEKCWNVLSVMKDGPISSFSGEEFFAFQPTLASALFRLDEAYRSLSQEHKRIVKRKNSLSSKWLRHRLKTITIYQHALTEVISVGKALGDAFAWAFYRNNRSYLDKHYMHEKITHTPPGIGGQGELEFIRNVRDIKGQFVLYHGITTFLRVGDISLIDLKTMTVTAIGDLKTKSSAPNVLDITLYFTGPHIPERIPLDTPNTLEHSVEPSLPPKMEDNLRKQFKKMEDSFNNPKPNRSIELNDNTQMDALNSVAVGLEQANVVYEKVGDGLMLIGMKSWRKNSLSSNLLGITVPNLNKRFGNIIAQVKRLIDMDQVNTPLNANSIFMGHLSTVMLIGTMPLFWWPVQTEFLRKLIFREVSVLTVYNPAHLIKKLRAIGYEVELVGDGSHHKVTKKMENSKLEILGMDHFESLVKDYLMGEDTIVGLLSDMLKKAKAGELPPNSMITLAVQQEFRGRRRRSTQSNKRMQRRPRSSLRMIRSIRLAAPLMLDVRRLTV